VRERERAREKGDREGERERERERELESPSGFQKHQQKSEKPKTLKIM
jgi:hypothetical protein